MCTGTYVAVLVLSLVVTLMWFAPQLLILTIVQALLILNQMTTRMQQSIFSFARMPRVTNPKTDCRESLCILSIIPPKHLIWDAGMVQ